MALCLALCWSVFPVQVLWCSQSPQFAALASLPLNPISLPMFFFVATIIITIVSEKSSGQFLALIVMSH
jgi:hypothetical protein